jgi:hypothetical protein
MTSTQIITLMIFHGVFDWLFQDRETAKKKSSNFKYLVAHLFILYTGILVWACVFGGLGLHDTFLFAVSNVILHGIIDWNLWKLYKLSVLKRFKEADGQFAYWEDSWFYNFIMVDQLLHGICYVVLFFLLR